MKTTGSWLLDRVQDRHEQKRSDEDPNRFTVRLEPDHDALPYEWQEGVELEVFGSRRGFVEGDGIGRNNRPRPAGCVREFVDSHYRAPNTVRFLVGEHYPGPTQSNVGWNLWAPRSRIAGVITVPTGPEGFTYPREAAAAILAEYSAWANGDVYGYVVEDHGVQVGSCWGIIGETYAREMAAEEANWRINEAGGHQSLVDPTDIEVRY